MIFHIPNNPVRVTVDLLKRLSDTEPVGKRLAEDKWDGWRRRAYKIKGVWTLQAKANGGDEAKVDLPDYLMKDLAELFIDLDDIAIDMEWVGPRNKDALREAYGAGYNGLRLFDLLYINGQYIGGTPERQRYDSLKTIYELCRAKRPHAAKYIEMVRCWDHDWYAMFEENRRNPLLEGIVLKMADGKLVNKADNPFWFKIKYRDIHEPTKF
jgi:ATP-dependent DNA ligase